ncbi:MAG: peptidoglycan DD-metalloendopeptidase family protein [Deltaproteobacteria bacterium]|nr:peptidoglycan DD-metalloendopeptidase family protein [Deltaproteobacteria bacterium]
MGPNLKWLALAILPILVACSSTTRLVKKEVTAPPPIAKPAPSAEKESHPNTEEEGAFHIVGKGETLHRICEVYGLDLAKVARINSLTPPYTIREGDTVFLPARALLSDHELAKAQRNEPRTCSLENNKRHRVADAIRGEKHPWVHWMRFPVPGGELTSPFGYRWGRFHKGLDIAAPLGAPVLACAEGRIVFSGTRKRFRRYGNTALIHHGNGVYTYYAHLDRISVKKNQKVRQGQHIGTIGNTGRSTGPHLHLEVRVGNQLYNPLAYFQPKALAGVRLAKRFTNSPMGPVRAGWDIPDLLTASR